MFLVIVLRVERENCFRYEIFEISLPMGRENILSLIYGPASDGIALYSWQRFLALIRSNMRLRHWMEPTA